MHRPDYVLVRGASQLVTVRGSGGPRRGSALSDLSIVDGGAILIQDGVITHVGSSHRIENLENARRAREVDARGGVVLPGFVDCHTHLVRPSSRSGGESDGGSSCPATVPRLRLHQQPFLEWMALHGTTTAEIKSCTIGDESGELRALRAIQRLDGSPIKLIPTVFASATPSMAAGSWTRPSLEWCIKELLPRAGQRKLASFGDIACGPCGYSLREARIYLDAARRLGLPTRLHSGLPDCSAAIRLAIEMGAISADHLDTICPESVEALADSNTIATLIPGVLFDSHCSRRQPVRDLLNSGAAVALATGFDGRDYPSCSMPMVLSMACRALGFTAAEAIAAATINGAHALLCADRIGSLEVGKQADFLVASVRDYRDLPYYFGVQLVSRTFRRGIEITPERKQPDNEQITG